MRAWRAWPVVLLAIPASVALAADHEVVTVGTSFSPKSIDVAVGDTVTWRNASGGHHNVHFDDGATNGPPATGQWTYPRTFAEAGEYGYMCDFHGPSMSGVVRVGLPPVDTPTPTPTASSVPTPTVTPTPTVGSVPDPSGTPTATPEPGAQPTSVTSLRVQRRARRGRVRVSAVVEPEGIQLTIVVRRGKRVVGRRTLTAPAEGAVSAQVRLGREARRRLRRSGRLRLRVEVVAGTERAATTVRVRP